MSDASSLLKQAVAATVKHEEWKYTNVQSLLAIPFRLQGTTDREQVPMEHGTWNVEHGTWNVERGTPFVTLTESLADGITEIRIQKNEQVEAPLQLNVETDATASDVMHAKRYRIVVEEGASLVVVESHTVVGENAALDLTVTEIEVHENANCEYIKIVDTPGALKHIGSTFGKVHRNGKLSAYSICIDGAFVRNDVNMKLSGEGSEVYLYGASVLNESEYADNHTIVDHEVPHCHSEELYKGVYDGKSIGVFNGKIFVRAHAQKTTAYQSCKSILLSQRAQVNVKPQLEIWADDVKCSHGATTGQIDEDALFYLRARGLSADEARALITYAHAAEVVEKMSNTELRLSIERRIAEKLCLPAQHISM